MFRFTDKEDRVGVGVYDVRLEPGEKDALLFTEAGTVLSKRSGVVTILYGSGGNRRTEGESLALSNIQGIGGSILLMLSHGLVSSALFLCVGVLYDRHKTLIVRYFGGLLSRGISNLSRSFPKK
ncbi:hypothetical protein ZIOFF_074464 (mitochondrion) [Zingiber officinale]|uniref:NADH:quinone oxidoreductase/Mrp antiporter transmembrane domain-containing protein n=1 Tax=Zingiber officinale TaxID=94328 RepID=A0A8J5ESL3_ZINOF|nr:hypothetical protein ZIOFF_075488 [Zingiber officinale]KAG6467669.1 hypothetical protein ZIOFF_074464 [Zingiber officinale]